MFRNADPSNLRGCLLEVNKDHLLDQARSDLAKQELHVESLNKCIGELQQQTEEQRLASTGRHITDLLNLDENMFDYKENYPSMNKFFEILKSEICTKCEILKERKNFEQMTRRMGSPRHVCNRRRRTREGPEPASWYRPVNVGKTSSESRRRENRAARKGKWSPRGTGTTVLYPCPSQPCFGGSKVCARVTGKAGENGQYSGEMGTLDKTVGSRVW